MKAIVKMNGQPAGILERQGSTVTFQYDCHYLTLGQPALSKSLPLRQEPYESEGLPAYFSGLVSEGWLKRVQSREQRIDLTTILLCWFTTETIYLEPSPLNCLICLKGLPEKDHTGYHKKMPRTTFWRPGY